MYIPEPCAQARYGILRARYLELAESGIIAPIDKPLEEECQTDEDVLLIDHPMNGSESPPSSPVAFYIPSRSRRPLHAGLTSANMTFARVALATSRRIHFLLSA